MWVLVQKPQPLMPNRYLKCAIDVLPIRPRPLYKTLYHSNSHRNRVPQYEIFTRTFFSESCTYCTMWWNQLLGSILILNERRESCKGRITGWPAGVSHCRQLLPSSQNIHCIPLPQNGNLYCCSTYDYFIFRWKCRYTIEFQAAYNRQHMGVGDIDR